MITGGKIGGIIGRKRAFSIGCVIYGAGSMTTALAKSLTVLIFGWSLLEGIGAALILPAVVALVAANFPAEARPKAYGLVMAAGAIAVAVGPLIGGLFTTYSPGGYVFAGEVLIVLVILVLARKIVDEPVREAPQARRRRRRALGLGSRDRRLRCAQVGHVGLDHPALRGARPLGDLADDLADLRRCLRALALPPLGAAAHVGGQGDPRAALDVQGRRSCAAGCGCSSSSTSSSPGLLRRAALPLGLARALGDPDRRAVAAALDDAPARRGGHPALLPGCEPAAGRAARAPRDVRAATWCCSPGSTPMRPRPSSPCRCSCSGSGSARSPRSSAASRSRRCPTARAPRSAACRTRRRTSAPRSGRRSPGLCSIATLTSVFLVGIVEQPGRPAARQRSGDGPARRRHPVRLGRRSADGARRCARHEEHGRRDRRGELRPPGSTRFGPRSRSSPASRSSRSSSPAASRPGSRSRRRPSPRKRAPTLSDEVALDFRRTVPSREVHLELSPPDLMQALDVRSA